ncbi:nectin-3-like protein [Clarias gariepinus]|uniref:uncharacterized protein LOC128511801 n=1 Tax=Clarias gariepinus TaxID=13013 RepID=UPI00234DF58A|nr:uncharacterized protein LOC128511801 [Clarias gariepinus]
MRNEHPKRLLFFCLVFIKACLAGDGLTVSDPVEVGLGQSASLSCKVKDELHVTQAQWTRCNDSRSIAVLKYETNGKSQASINELYHGQVSITEYHTLTFHQVREDDFGEYCCKLTTFPSGILEGRVLLLKHKEKKVEVDTTESPPAGLPVMMIVYITCGVVGFVILTGIITVLVFTMRRRKVRNPVHVVVTHTSLSAKQPSFIRKDSDSLRRDDNNHEDDDGDMYLEIKSSEP